MEPGLRDREYVMLAWMIEEGAEAAMEPGLRDREYHLPRASLLTRNTAAMEPGLRDREYTHTPTGERLPGVRCNGARS